MNMKMILLEPIKTVMFFFMINAPRKVKAFDFCATQEMYVVPRSNADGGNLCLTSGNSAVRD